MSKFAAIAKSILLLLLTIWLAVFGQIQWQAPTWIKYSFGMLKKFWQLSLAKPTKALGILCVVVIFLAAGGYSYHWWQNRPQPATVDFSFVAPERTPLEKENAKPNPLVINFNVSVAPLNMVGKDVSQGIRIAPEIQGSWHWTSDKTLEFRPHADWPISGSHQVEFESGLLAEHILLARDEFKFDTPKFGMKLDKSEFYQDPLDAKVKKAIFELSFTHPVDADSLQKHLRLKRQNSNQEDHAAEKVDFSISYDKLRLHASIQSQILELPRYAQSIKLELEAGTLAANSKAEIAETLNSNVDIPGLYNGLTIQDVQLTVSANPQTQTQDQVLLINASQTVHEQLMAKAVQVWELPESHPENPSTNNEPYNWSASEVSEAILKQSKLLPIQPIPAEQEFSQMHSLRLQADVKRSLYVRIAKNLRSFGGYLLADDYYQALVVPEFPQELHIMGEGSLLTMSGEKKLAVMTRNMAGLKVELGRILPDQLQHLISQSRGDFSHPEFIGDFGQDNLSERFEVQLPLTQVAEGRPQYQAVDLSRYLLDNQGQSKRGVFLVTAKNYQPEQDQAASEQENEADNKEDSPENSEEEAEGESEEQVDEATTEVEDKRLILVTDLGIITKNEQNGGQVIFVQSIQSGMPQSGAEVSMIALNGQTLQRGTTDNEGKVRFTKISDIERERAPMLFIVRYQGDMSFLPVNRSDRKLNFSRFDVGGAENASDANQLDAYLFSDRGIYRPGEEIHIGMIVRTAGWNMPLNGLPLEAEILDARDMVAKRIKLNLAEGGFNELAYTPPESAPTGLYSINLYTVKGETIDQLLGSTRVKVEEFQPDRMKVDARFSKTASEGGWVSPKDLKALVNAQNLYGSPAEARQVTAQLTLKPVLPEFKRYRSYRFYDPHYVKDGAEETMAPINTDASGNATFALGLEKYQQASYLLNFSAQAFEAQGGRSVASEASILVSDLPYLVGYKLDGPLSFVARDTQRSVHLIAIDPNLKLTSAENLTLEHVEHKVLSVLKRQDDGTYRYESRPKESVLNKTPLQLVNTGLDLNLDTKNPGDYSYVIRDAQGLILSKIEYSVAGEGNVSRTLDRNTELQITLDKTEYEPGDTISLNIRAPYTGAGLITVERDKVYASAWFKSTTQASVQQISVPKELLGNAYVSVQYIREPGSDEIFMSPLSYGVAGFKVSHKAHTQNLQLSVPESIKPGQNLKIQLKSAEPTKAVVFAVDEGILQVARYQNPKPLDYFFQKRQLSVETTQILDLILPEFKKLMQLSAPGGDGEDDEPASLLNPFKRKHDQPAVYWSGIVDVGDATELNYTVPETFNGSLRVMAIAVNAQRIASVAQKTLVRDDLIITPNAPFMVAPGDEFTVSVAVANHIKGSGPKAPIMVNLVAPATFGLTDAAEKTLAIDEGHEASTTFSLKVKEGASAELGNASLEFTAQNADHSSRMHAYLSVRPATPRVSTLQLGHFNKELELPLSRQMFPQQRRVTAGASPLPLVAVTALSDYLENFNHSCTEQLVSKAIPVVVLSKHSELSTNSSSKSDPQAMAKLLSVLRSRQNSQGGFGLWLATPQAHEFASVYALHLLLEASANDLTVPEDMLQKALDYAQSLAASPASDLDGLRVRAYAVYLLTRQGIVTSSNLATIREALRNGFTETVWQQDLATVYLAASYQMLKQHELAEELIQNALKAMQKSNKNDQFANYYDPVIYNAQTLYLLAKHFPEKIQKLPPVLLENLAQAMENQHFNTLSSAYYILAYQAYIEAVPQDAAQQLKIFERDQQGQLQALAIQASFAPRAAVPYGSKGLRFEGPEQIPLYYSLAETGFDLQVPSQEVHKGLEIQRAYLNAEGKAVTTANLGEELNVQIRIRAIHRDWISDIAVQDLLPAGFEAVIPPKTQVNEQENNESNDANENDETPVWQDRLKTDGNWQTDYVDVREDRVLLYGTITSNVMEYRYQVKATAAGNFTVPPIYAQSMYEPQLQANTAVSKFLVSAR